MTRVHPLIRLEGVERRYDDGAIVALKKVDLVIASGECIAILGPSGSGKSSLLNILSGIDMPTKGQVYWNDLPVRSRREWAVLRGSDIGIVFQEFNLLPTLTALENIELVPRLLNWESERCLQRARPRFRSVSGKWRSALASTVSRVADGLR